MTNEEAIHKLEYSKKAYQMLIDEKVDSGKFVGKDVEGEWKADTPLDEAYKSMIEALDMAIKALEQQPCEDCISRENLLNSIEEPMNWTDSEAEIQEQKDYENFVALVKSMPPVTPQPKLGHWIAGVDRWGDIVTTVNGYRCSECCAFNADKDNYCPNCGAKMEVEE